MVKIGFLLEMPEVHHHQGAHLVVHHQETSDPVMLAMLKGLRLVVQPLILLQIPKYLLMILMQF